jgi:hypothetical protein
MSTTSRRAHQLLHGWPHSIDTMRWMIPFGRPVQPGSKQVLRLLRCDYHFARNPAERYLIILRQFCYRALIQSSTSLYEDMGERWVFKSRLKQDLYFARLPPLSKEVSFRSCGAIFERRERSLSSWLSTSPSLKP